MVVGYKYPRGRDGWKLGDLARIGPMGSDLDVDYSSYEDMIGEIFEFDDNCGFANGSGSILARHARFRPGNGAIYAVLYCPAKMEDGKPPQTRVPVCQLERLPPAYK